MKMEITTTETTTTTTMDPNAIAMAYRIWTASSYKKKTQNA